jgi:hypothetical protein
MKHAVGACLKISRPLFIYALICFVIWMQSDKLHCEIVSVNDPADDQVVCLRLCQGNFKIHHMRICLIHCFWPKSFLDLALHKSSSYVDSNAHDKEGDSSEAQTDVMFNVDSSSE